MNLGKGKASASPLGLADAGSRSGCASFAKILRSLWLLSLGNPLRLNWELPGNLGDRYLFVSRLQAADRVAQKLAALHTERHSVWIVIVSCFIVGLILDTDSADVPALRS